MFDEYVRQLKEMKRFGIRVIFLISSTDRVGTEIAAVAGIMINMQEKFKKKQRPIYVATTFHWAQTGTTEDTDPDKFATFNEIFSLHFHGLTYGPQSIPEKRNFPTGEVASDSSSSSMGSIIMVLALTPDQFHERYPNDARI